MRNGRHAAFIRKLIFLLTFVSFVAILLFLWYFAIFAPGNCNLEGPIKESGQYGMDIAFAALLIINQLCCLLSFAQCLKECYFVLHMKTLSIKSVFVMILGIYPALVILALCSWDCNTLVQYLMSPYLLMRR